MEYKNIVEGEFISRPNRFIAKVLIGGKEETVHVKNTGRCKELLVKGCKVFLSQAENPERKTAYDLVAVNKEGKTLINMDSQVVNGVAEEWLRKGNIFPKVSEIRREVRYGNSRFDIYAEYGERRAFIEVKGVTLEREGKALFPDAPTERGLKHLGELVKCLGEGYEAYVLFIVQMRGISSFSPNDETHRAFGDMLRYAAEKGVKVLALGCDVTPNTIVAGEEIEVEL